VIVNKPAGLLVIPTPKNETRTLTSILNDDLKEKGVSYRLHPCHRLDRDTSGLIIYAKGKSWQKRMMDLFKSRQIKKKYIAFVHGAVNSGEGQIKRPIAGVFAHTIYKVLETRKDYTVVEIILLTGRTNQIRIHFAGIGHPLMGEDKFAFRRDFKVRMNKLCLHAKELGFIHPLTRQNLYFEAELPKHMKEFLERKIIDG
jgi:23S rRNA pseudouridine1911/1915/1917 synthase